MTDDAGPDARDADSDAQVAESTENADPDAPVDFTPGELTGTVDADDDGHDEVDEQAEEIDEEVEQ